MQVPDGSSVTVEDALVQELGDFLDRGKTSLRPTGTKVLKRHCHALASMMWKACDPQKSLSSEASQNDVAKFFAASANVSQLFTDVCKGPASPPDARSLLNTVDSSRQRVMVTNARAGLVAALTLQLDTPELCNALQPAFANSSKVQWGDELCQHFLSARRKLWVQIALKFSQMELENVDIARVALAHLEKLPGKASDPQYAVKVLKLPGDILADIVQALAFRQQCSADGEFASANADTMAERHEKVNAWRIQIFGDGENKKGDGLTGTLYETLLEVFDSYDKHYADETTKLIGATAMSKAHDCLTVCQATQLRVSRWMNGQSDESRQGTHWTDGFEGTTFAEFHVRYLSTLDKLSTQEVSMMTSLKTAFKKVCFPIDTPASLFLHVCTRVHVRTFVFVHLFVLGHLPVPTFCPRQTD